MASLLVRRAASLPPSFSNQLRQLFSASSLTITHQNASGPIRRMTTNGQSSRPFQVLGLQQIAIGGLDKSPLSNLWTNIFGVPKIGNFKSESEKC
eukprot:CCRYP_015914-RA/>CCRYP_015914-RA protein AED:0.03 eAED:0.03 QI:214/1/1/1/1/1/2/466/94